MRSTTTKCTRGRGCNGHPAFPTPSLGGRFINGSGAWRGEVVNVCLLFDNLHQFGRPGECRDPYAVPFVFGTLVDTFRNHKRRWLWVPAFAGTTQEFGPGG